jgi:hypothetical protein
MVSLFLFKVCVSPSLVYYYRWIMLLTLLLKWMCIVRSFGCHLQGTALFSMCLREYEVIQNLNVAISFSEQGVVMMQFSRAISRVKWLSGEKTNVSKTISVLVLRVLLTSTLRTIVNIVHRLQMCAGCSTYGCFVSCQPLVQVPRYGLVFLPPLHWAFS